VVRELRGTRASAEQRARLGHLVAGEFDRSVNDPDDELREGLKVRRRHVGVKSFLGFPVLDDDYDCGILDVETTPVIEATRLLPARRSHLSTAPRGTFLGVLSNPYPACYRDGHISDPLLSVRMKAPRTAEEQADLAACLPARSVPASGLRISLAFRPIDVKAGGSMTAEIESAWPRYPDYRIDTFPCAATGQVWAGDMLVAESGDCLSLTETAHVDRLYFPAKDVQWELFEATQHHTICPFKGQADYWSLVATDPVEENVVWAYPTPFPEVGAIAGYVSFYHERLRVVLNERWRDGSVVTTRFPKWGDASDLLGLMDVEQVGERRFVGPAFGPTARNVVESGQLLGQALVAASKTLPSYRVTSASMVFSKAATFDAPVDLDVEILRGGRTFSTVEVRASQDGSLRSTGLLLLDSGAPDLIHHCVPMPDVAGPDDSVPHDFGLSGRDLRVVAGAYNPDPNLVGPPELYVWVRFRDAPPEPYLHAALLTQSTGHWTVGAAMRPHLGFGEADAHKTLSTGVLQTTVAFHDEVDVSEWLLYANPAIYAGRGLAQGEGRVFTEDGRLVASYSVQVLLRAFQVDPASMGHDSSTAM